MAVRRVVAYGLMLLALVGLAACGASQQRAKPGAWVHLALLTTGDAQVDVYPAGHLKSDAEAVALTSRLAKDAFPRSEDVRAHMEAGQGRPYARAHVRGAYRRGRTVRLTIDLRNVWQRLSDQGFTEAGVRLELPQVSGTVRGSTSHLRGDERAWTLRGAAPVVQVTMRPRPERWYGVMALPVIAAIGVGMGFFVRRQAVAMPAVIVALVASVASVAVGAGRQGDNLGVAGVLAGSALKTATVAPLAALALGLPAAMLLVAMIVRRLRIRRPERAAARYYG
ncbi:hypothetical protein J4573_42110 [Actinomadura barringtoniae]|uniref:Lipoprotein n=1 Tax=Actinomadura barringtoniae TaxID=1427535 RepID=A0A939T904_9ACTN|nr:hypothetical protein [Actinomadura barringtoniae]MBO2453744.1 hypothetical protein [Actinomadura barringtoniae]